MDVIWFGLLVVGVALLGTLAGGGRGREDVRARRRFDAAFEHESRRTVHTDATGVLLCRSCGASASERAGRCPRCGAML
jgi:ribosomal protein L40E